MSRLPSDILPSGMDSRKNAGAQAKDKPLRSWQLNIEHTLNKNLGLTERPRPQDAGSSLRAVTPDPEDEQPKTTRSRTPTRPMPFEIPASPRSIPGGEKSRDRRQGLVFDDEFDMSSDSSLKQSNVNNFLCSPSPTQHLPDPRPRTRTLEDGYQQRNSTLPGGRQRTDSVHAASIAFQEGLSENQPVRLPEQVSASTSAAPPAKSSKKLASFRDKTGRKLSKKLPPNVTSPLMSPGQSIDSLPVPLATSDANKILRLMKSLNGRMRGVVEYQILPAKQWVSGLCYVDVTKGGLMYEGDDRGPFYQVLIPDLRGCRVFPSVAEDRQWSKCLEITSIGGIKLVIIPLLSTEFDHWLAALLSWQQTKLGAVQPTATMPDVPEPSPTEKPNRSSKSIKEYSIIKVGKLLLWDKEYRPSPAKGKSRISSRDPPTDQPVGAWKRVSCILQDNGEFKLLSDNDIIILSVIQLSQLSRCAIQRLDRSVLGEEYCIALLPQYTATSTAISIIRPVYIALEQRVLFEVWYVLLRAFAIPEVYGPQPSYSGDGNSDISGSDEIDGDGMFRVDKSISLRIIEAKVKLSTFPDIATSGKHATKDRPEYDPVVGDYFAEAVLDGEVRARTMVKHATRNPFWRSDFDFLDLPSSLSELSIVLKRRLPTPEALHQLEKHGHRSTNSVNTVEHPSLDVVCGLVNIQVNQLDKGKEQENWWPVYDEHNEKIAEIFIKLRHEEMVILLSKDYQQLLDLLHNFDNGLGFQIAQLMPSRLKALSETLVNIFQVSGQAHNWLMALVEEEIDGVGNDRPSSGYRFNSRLGSNGSIIQTEDRELTVRDMSKSLTGEANLLFRGNSLLTQAVDFYMRRLGKEYLGEVLATHLEQINILDPHCEVDPARLVHGEDLSKNWAQLIALTTRIWEAISASAQRCPAALRQILKFIRAVADDRYGDFLRTVPYTSVSGFLFLRFFCPAILNPKLFGLLPDHAPPHAQRTLTLIAKSLQVLANLSNFGQKEAWMSPMNKFLSSHRQELKDYIDAITSISSERSVNLVPASYSTPIAILGRLPPASREGFPSLPYLIDQTQSLATLIRLWLTSTSDHVHTTPLVGDLLSFHNICVALQQRTDECLDRAETSAAAQENMPTALQWDDLVNNFDRAQLSPTDSELSPLHIDSSALSSTASVPGSGTGNTSMTLNAIAGSYTGQNKQLGWSPSFGAIMAYSSNSASAFALRHSRSSFSSASPTASISEQKTAPGIHREIRRAGSESERDNAPDGQRTKQGFWDKQFSAVKDGRERRRPDINLAESGGSLTVVTGDEMGRRGSKSGAKKDRDRQKEREKEKEKEKEKDRNGDGKAEGKEKDKDKDKTPKQSKGIFGLGVGQSKKDKERERHEDKKSSIEVIRNTYNRDVDLRRRPSTPGMI